MPAIEVAVRGEDRTEWSYKADCWVRGDGHFVAHVADEIATAARELAGATPEGVQHVGVYESSTRTLATCQTLDSLVRFLRAAALSWHNGVVTTTRVIRYVFNHTVSFWEDPAGGLHANGYSQGCVGNPARSGGWWKPKSKGTKSLHATNHAPTFSLGLGAKVFDKIVTTRSTGETVRYVKVIRDEDPAVTALNSWIGIDDSDWKEGMVQEVPYTPEAALFFAETLRGLCHVVKRFDAFFSSTTNVLAAAAQSRPLLPSPSVSSAEWP